MAEQSLVFGRGPGAEVTIEDQYVSPQHCRISLRNGSYYIEDLASTNGTRIIRQGQQIPVPWLLRNGLKLEPGDKVKIGRTILPWEVPA